MTLVISAGHPGAAGLASADPAGTAVPEVSVVIASVNGADYLDTCLSGLLHQRGHQRDAIPFEVIVADRIGADVRALVDQKYPRVRLLSFDPRRSIPELRAMGIAQSTGRLVAVTEDHCVPAEDWIERIVAAHESDYIAVGGPVEYGRAHRLVDWAVFLCEYYRHAGPLVEGESWDLPGMNVAYKRVAFDHVRDLLEEKRWEDALHARLAARGFSAYVDPSLRVSHQKSFTVRGFLSERYHYARAFAGMRVAGATWPRRLAYGIGALALPPLLLERVASRLFRRRRHRAVFVAALPLIALFTLSWAVGESVGYLAGPGDSLAKVK